MPAPNLGPGYDFSVRLRTLEQLVRQLMQNQIGQAFSATQSDGSVGMQVRQNVQGAGSTALAFYQGPNTTRNAQTGMHPLLMYVGQLFVNGAPSDSGVLLYRPDGGQIAALGAGGFEFRELSAANQIAISTDQASREGLATPWLPLPAPQQTGIGNWPKTTTSGVIAQTYIHAQHPKVWWNASAYADAGSSGSVSLTITCGSQSVSSASFPVSSGAFTSIDTVLTLPQPFFGQAWTVSVNASATGGGNVYCQTFGFYGRQS